MPSPKEILSKIKEIVLTLEPDATIILYGSYARRSEKPASDIDLLILVNKKITWSDQKRIANSLYHYQYAIDIPISPVVKSRTDWESKYRFSDFYMNIQEEGILL